MWRRVVFSGFVAGFIVLLAGCDGGGAGKDDSGSTAADDSGGGGGGSNWRPAGEGYAYFSDGVDDNSVLQLELTRCIDPQEGMAYHGWLSKGGADPVPLGEISCVGGEVHFSAEVGTDALVAGYDTFDAWQTADATPTGTHLWTGQVDPALLATVTELVLADPSTRDGEGSLRSLKTQVTEFIAWADAAAGQKKGTEEGRAAAEALSNSIAGTIGDFDGDGTTSTVDGSFPILGSGGYVPLILADIESVSKPLSPDDPGKEYANNAYDCVQRAESAAEVAVDAALIGTACGAESTCDAALNDAALALGVALVGEDVNGDKSIDPDTEGTTDCALYYVAQLMRMTVTIP